MPKYPSLLLLIVLVCCACSGNVSPIAPDSTPAATASPEPTLVPIPEEFYLGDLTPSKVVVGGWQLSIGTYPVSDDGFTAGETIHYLGTPYPKGILAVGRSYLVYPLKRKYSTFISDLFILPGCSDGALFEVVADDTAIYSRTIFPGEAAVHVDLDVSNVDNLRLYVTTDDAGNVNCDWAVWGDARLLPAASQPITATPDSKTPPALAQTRIGEVIASYRDLGNYDFSESQIAQITNALTYVQINDASLGVTRYYWYLARQKLMDAGETDLANMLGNTPLIYSEDGVRWIRPGFKDVTDIPIGGEFAEWDSDPYNTRTSVHQWDFSVVTSDWIVTSFNQQSIFDFITINPDGTVILHTDLIDWESHAEDITSAMALRYIQPTKKIIDPSGKGRQLYFSHILGGGAPQGFEQLTREQAISVLQQYIAAVVNRYKDRVFAYSVVNEFRDAEYDVLWKVIGPDYIDLAFEAVREADPTAITVLNHYENHVNRGPVTIEGKTIPETIQIVASRLQEKGLIDYIGSECHIEVFPLTPHNETFEEVEAVFRDYPVPVLVTEFDVNMQEYAKQPDAYLTQSDKAKTIFSAALASGNVHSFTFWGGFPDNRSFPTVMVGDPDAHPGPWAENWQEKPMFFAIQSVLFSDYLKNHQAN